MPIDFVEESAPKIDFVPDEQTPSLDRELEREDLRRQMREARAEAYGNKAIQGLSDIGYGISHAIAQAGAKVDPTGVVANMLAREGYQPTQLISPEAVTQDLRTIGEFAREGLGNLGIRPGPLPEVISKPVEEFAAENIAAIPEMAPQLVLGKFQPRSVGRLFQAQMGAQVPAAVGQLAQAETPEEAVKGALQVGAAAGFPALIELGQRPRLTPIPDIPGRALPKREGAKPPTAERQAEIAVQEQLPPTETITAPPTTKLSPEAERATEEFYREAAESKAKVQREYPPIYDLIVKETGLSQRELDALMIPHPSEVTHPSEVARIAQDLARNAPGGRMNKLYDLLANKGQTGKFLWGGTADQPRIGFDPDVPSARPDLIAARKSLETVNKIRGVFGFEPLPDFFAEQKVKFTAESERPLAESTPKPVSPAQVEAAVTVAETVKPEAEGGTYPPWASPELAAGIRRAILQKPGEFAPFPEWENATADQKRLLLASGFEFRNESGNMQIAPKLSKETRVSKIKFTETPAAPVAETAKAAEVVPEPPPSPEAQAKPAAAPTEAKTEVGEVKAKQPWEMTAEEAAKVTGLTWDKWQDSISEATKAGKITEDSDSYKSAAKTGNRDFAKLKNEAQKQPPPQPSAGIEVKKQGAEGKAEEPQPPKIQGMGGATPAEFAKGQGSPTAMKYRLIDQERQKRGLEPLSKPDRISDQAVMDKAIAAMDQNPNLPDQLIKELRAKPRAIEDWENHVLLLRKIELREEYHKAAREAMQAYADSVEFPSRLADMQAANARTQFYSEKLTELEEASRVAGSARGRALRALRVMANEDFSLASLEMEKRAANNWRPLTPDERAELIKIADEHKAKSEELQKRLDELEKSQQDKEVGTVLTNLKAEVKRNPVAPTSIDLLSGKIRGKLEKDPKADIRFYVRKIARFFVSQGTKERDVLVDQVHGVLSGIIPDLDRRTTMDLISGYGDYSRLPKDTVSVILRDLSGQMQQIAKLEDMMRGEAPLRSGQERRTPSDVERILQKQVEEQKKKGGYTVTDPETQLRTAQEAVQKRLQNQITDLELQIQTRQKIIKNPTKLQYDAKSNQLKARRDELKAVYDEIFAKPAKTEAERLAEWKERTKDRIDELKEFLAGTKQPKQKPTPVVLDKEALRIRFDLHTIERLWREKLAKEKRDQWTRWQKAKTIPAEVLNVSRALLTSFDFSAPGRQGIIVGLAHPIRAASALKPMFEAWRSEKGAFDAAEQIRNRNNAPLYEIGKLYLAEHGGRLSRQEEAYMSRWAAKIPGIRASERAYVTFLNRLRADSFDSMVEGFTANGTANPAELKAIANFINVATGRGVGLERSGTTLNTVFFAPRYVFSRFQFLAGQPLYKGTAATRKAIAKEYGKFLAGAAVVYALASSAGADVGTDPRSSDFGKIIIGNTRIDPMAGLNQVSTLVGRTVSGETKPIKGRAYPIVGKVPYGKSNLLDVMMNFGRGKLSPAIGTGISLRLGKDVANQPFGVSDLPKSMGVPISWQDMYSAMREEGVPAGIAMGMLSMFGIGVNTYEQQNRR